MSDRLLRVMTTLICEPWLVTPQVHRTLTEIAAAHAAGGGMAERQHALADGMMPNPKPVSYTMRGRSAVIPGEGVFARKFSNVLQSSGITSTDVFEGLVRKAAADPAVESIVLMMDSPGGYHMGVPEAARAVREANAVKPVLAYVDGMCCSAAYWIASQADVIYAMESGDIGSVGCYMALLDQTRALEMQGYRVELFRSGKHKGMGIAGVSLTEEQQQMLQAEVDQIGVAFKAAVQAGRGGTIRDEDLQGQSFSAEQALSKGLIDAITDADTALRDAERLVGIRANQKGRA